MSDTNDDDYRVATTFIKPGHENYDACRRLCFQSRVLHNVVVYKLRHDYFAYRNAKAQDPNVNFSKFRISKKDLECYVKKHYAACLQRSCSAAMAQKCVHRTYDAFQIFVKQVRAKLQAPSNNPKKIGLPGYAKKYSTCVIAPNGFRTKDGFLTITGAENVGLHPIPLDKRVFKDDQGFCPSSDKAIIKEVRFVPFSNGFKIEVVYDLKKVASKPQHGLNPDLFMALDIGLTNLVTGITNVIGVPPIIFKGGKVKSINQWYNKRAAKLKAAASKKSSSAAGKNKHLKAIAGKRYWQLHAIFHEVSRRLVDFCIIHKIGKLIIGHSKGWKQSINLGKRNNQNFVSVPYNKLIHLIAYKAKWEGIEVVVREESYTSKASALDFDPIPTYGEKDAEKVTFSGTREHRGLFVTSDGRTLNADVNGAINIARKELGDDWLKELVGLYRGCLVNTPVVLNTTRKSPLQTALTLSGCVAMEIEAATSIGGR